MRKRAAVWAGKATGALSRATRRYGGTTFPGDVARAIDPAVLRKLSSDLSGGAVVITGTNGKTTTARLISRLLEGLPSRVVANREGSNLIFGVTAASVAAAGLAGRLDADWGVFEIDERHLPAAVEEIQPRVVLVGNLFRDQLDRYGELESIAGTIQRALGKLKRGRAVLNADDPRLGEIGLRLEQPPLWYGLDDPGISIGALPHAADATTCPICGSRLAFDSVHLGHLGAYLCPQGHFGRPPLDVAGHQIRLKGMEEIALRIGETEFQLPLGGLYNAYNLVGAVAAGLVLGLDPAYMAERLAGVEAAFGRQERLEVEGRHLVLVLSKNPAGFNEVLRGTIELAAGDHFLVAINDRIADGRDVSWLWDVDFELLARARTVLPAGVRAYDMAVRLKYAEVAAEPPEPDHGRAIDRFLELVPPGELGYILCTYTAMIELRAVMVKRGWLKPYWVRDES